MIKIQPLQWDSDFFNLRIGKVALETSDDFIKIKEQIKYLQGTYDLLYVFSSEKLFDIYNVVGNLVLADEKTIYEMNIAPYESCKDVKIYSESVPNDALYKLALVSGEYSRFKLDKSFPENSFKRLYYKWIEESVNRNIADAVFVHTSDDDIDGMVTVKWASEYAYIGLVAVDSNSQGKGVGTTMIKHLNAYLKQNTSVQRISVATQWLNSKARKWYEKNGFTVSSVTNIYHWWLSKPVQVTESELDKGM